MHYGQSRGCGSKAVLVAQGLSTTFKICNQPRSAGLCRAFTMSDHGVFTFQEENRQNSQAILRNLDQSRDPREHLARAV